MKIQWNKAYRNKYLIASVIFVLIVTFFDDNNLIERFKLIEESNSLKSQIEFYENEIGESNRKYKELETNSKNLEKFAREEFFMKKDNEEVYIIVDHK